MEKSKMKIDRKPELEFVEYKTFEAVPSKTVEGASQRIIAQIPDTNVATRILELEAGTDTSPDGVQAHDFWEELYIIEGSLIDLRLNEEFTAGMVACRPPGMEHGPWKSPNGCRIFEVRYYADQKKEEHEFVDHTTFEAQPFSKVKSLSERIIASDPTTGVATRILHNGPGTDTSPNGVQVHDFWEELYIIEGSLIDLRLNEEFTAGMVACRPPGMEHGPWKSPDGCKIFEVRYYSTEQ
ncbi:hypothetical protein [Peribacillus frigoritolerans]|uniref:hypothetical protein n=1 Tax=Peribacillus frigoritolerans TaxID=450367 RepID=UPI0025A08704|nr:hypothetical protein [Peribacillus frigoritolerans]MDM5310634.1 hypothetical protein [Peribacillus frigoritolerans]